MLYPDGLFLVRAVPDFRSADIWRVLRPPRPKRRWQECRPYPCPLPLRPSQSWRACPCSTPENGYSLDRAAQHEAASPSKPASVSALRSISWIVMLTCLARLRDLVSADEDRRRKTMTILQCDSNTPRLNFLADRVFFRSSHSRSNSGPAQIAAPSPSTMSGMNQFKVLRSRTTRSKALSLSGCDSHRRTRSRVGRPSTCDIGPSQYSKVTGPNSGSFFQRRNSSWQARSTARGTGLRSLSQY